MGGEEKDDTAMRRRDEDGVFDSENRDVAVKMDMGKAGGVEV